MGVRCKGKIKAFEIVGGHVRGLRPNMEQRGNTKNCISGTPRWRNKYDGCQMIGALPHDLSSQVMSSQGPVARPQKLL